MNINQGFILLAALVGLNFAYKITCGPNEVHQLCISPCPLTCSNFHDPPHCSPGIICQEGCACKEGYVLHNGTCILLERCPEPRCPGNQTYQFRNIHITTCDNIELDPLEPGCYCKPGYLWNRDNRECVLRSDCPRVCGPHQIYRPCASECRITCDNRHDPPICPRTRVCRQGCECEPGYVWHNNDCIPITECPHPKCDGNQTYVLRNIHVKTCDNLDLYPTTPGCYCLPGYFLNKRNGHCILKQDCPKDYPLPPPKCVQADGTLGPCYPCNVICKGYRPCIEALCPLS